MIDKTLIKKLLPLCLMVFMLSCEPNQKGETNWLSYGNDYSEQHYSPLSQINIDNVSDLKLNWELPLPDAIQFSSTPLAVEGMLYFTGDRAIVYAVDGRTGEIEWIYNPEIGKNSPRMIALGWNSNRGLAYLDGRLFLGATDGRLIAIDSTNGQEIWSVNTFEKVGNRSITAAPRAFNNTVIIGHGGADAQARGYVTAYDAQTGEQKWRFYTVPGNPADGFENEAMEMAAKTWHGEWWKYGGGGTVWHAITYDEEFNNVYLGTGNGAVWDHQMRSNGKGDNLFLGSVVALDADTGEYKWHYQAMPEESWDYNAAMDMILADLEIDGETKKVLMQAPKNGFLYVIDRANGKLIGADKFSKSNWAEKIDLETGRPVLGDAAYYYDSPTHLWPSPLGAHNFHAMAYSPKQELVYIPEMQLGAMFMKSTMPSMRDGFLNLAIINDYVEIEERDGTGSIVAMDPKTLKIKWKFEHESFWNGGILATGGDLVFQGTADGEFAAYNAVDGEKLWSVDAQRGITSAPISYTIDGKQHIMIPVGYGGLASLGIKSMQEGWKYKAPGIRVLSFSLEGKSELTRLDTGRHQFDPVDLGNITINASLADEGMGLYHGAPCGVCHGGKVNNSGAAAPDLREAYSVTDFETFRAMTQDGLLVENGMPQFDDLTVDEVRAIYEYVRQETKKAYDARAGT